MDLAGRAFTAPPFFFGIQRKCAGRAKPGALLAEDSGKNTGQARLPGFSVFLHSPVHGLLFIYRQGVFLL